MIKIFVSPQCPNCQRLVDSLNKVPSLQGRMQIIDIDRLDPSQRAGLQYVPTLVDSSNVQHVGSRAFEWVKQYDSEIELEPAPGGVGSLQFADLGGSGESQRVEGFGDFVPVT